MIDFNSTNLILDFTSSDNIGIDLFINKTRLNYIFGKYLYYKYSENITDSYVSYIQGIKDGVTATILADGELSNIEKVQLIYQTIMGIVDGMSIKVIISIKNPQRVTVIQTTEVSLGTLALLTTQHISGTRRDGYLQTIDWLIASEIKFNPIDEWMYTLDDVVNKTYTNKFQGTYQYKPDLMMIKSDIASLELDTLKLQSDFRGLYQNDSGQYNYKVAYDKFVFEITFNGQTQWLYLANTASNYKLRDDLYTLLTTISIGLPEQLFKFEQYSYINTPIYNTDYYVGNYIWYKNNPFCRQDLKFSFQDVAPSDLPTNQTQTIEVNNTSVTVTSPQQHLLRFKETVNYNIKGYNSYLSNYIINSYNDTMSDITSTTIYNSILLKYSNIKKYQNPIHNQYEFWDMMGEFVNNNIGAIDKIQYIDIQGFDSTNGLPIILYISDIIELNGNLQRIYKVINGGMTPINNTELAFQYISNNFTYIVDQFSVTNYTGDYYDYIAIHNYIQNLTSNFDSRYKYTVNVPANVSIFKDFETDTTGSKSYYLYKQENTIIPIISSDKKILPQQVLVAVRDSTSTDQLYTNLDSLFYKITDLKTVEDITYESLYLKYINSLTYKSFYILNDMKSIDMISILNKKLIDPVYKNIKQKSLLNIFSTTEQTDYTFTTVGDICSIDTTTYLNFKDMLLNDISYTIYDTDNTSITSKDDVMSILIGVELSKIQIDNTENSYIMAFYKFSDIVNTVNKFIIFNKVIGYDQLAFNNLWSDENDNTFSDYFINILSNMDDFAILLDLDSGKLVTVSTNPLSFNANTANPVIISKDIMSDRKLYKFSKDQLPLVLAAYKKYLHIQDVNVGNLAYAQCPINTTQNMIYDPDVNDVVILK